MQTYRSMKKDESHCDLLHFSVTVKGELEYSMSNIYHLEEKYKLIALHCAV